MTRLHIGPRSEVHTSEPDRPGNGTTQTWTREINGTRFSFTRVVFLFPSPIAGEIRWSVSRLTGDTSGRIFGHQWKRTHSYITFNRGGASAPAALVRSVVTPAMRRRTWESARVLADYAAQARAHAAYVTALAGRTSHPYLVAQVAQAQSQAADATTQADAQLLAAQLMTPHAEYPHEAGTLYDCPRCEAECPYANEVPASECDCVHHAIESERAHEASQDERERAHYESLAQQGIDC